MSTPHIRAALERLVELDDKPALCADPFMTVWADAIAAARAALAAEPVGGGGDARCARIELVTAIHCLASHVETACSDLDGDDLQKAKSDIAHAKSIAAKHNQNGPGCPQLFPAALPAPEQDDAWWHELVNEIARVQHVAAGEGQGPRFDLAEAVVRWCRPAAPPAPEVGEVGELVAWLEQYRDLMHPVHDSDDIWPFRAQFTRIATLLQQQQHLLKLAGQELDNFMEQQQAAPAPVVVPVAVSERLPGEGDCNEEGRCWCYTPREDFDGVLIMHSRWILSRPAGIDTHWLPAHAIPQPQAGEVQP